DVGGDERAPGASGCAAVVVFGYDHLGIALTPAAAAPPFVPQPGPLSDPCPRPMVRLATAVLRADQEQAIEAVREWYAQHGRLPRRPEWEKAARGRPTTRTIDRRWGWDKLLATASGRPPAQLRQAEFREHQRQLLLRLRAARDELGRWPASREWDRSAADHFSS